MPQFFKSYLANLSPEQRHELLRWLESGEYAGVREQQIYEFVESRAAEQTTAK